MKNNTTIFLILLLLILIGFGVYLYTSIENRSVPQGTHSTRSAATEKEDTKETTTSNFIQTAQPISETTQSDTEKSFGIVKGKLCYPSEYIPPMIVYLKNTDTNEIMTLDTLLDQSEFEFTNVLVGNYVAYAYVNEDNNDYGGGYTQMVPCGPSIECEDHTLIQFEVKKDEIATNIEICDWYDAEIPEKL